MANPYISSITLPSGSTYDIKDAEARKLIDDLENYSEYLGVTTTELTDGATTNPIVINGEDVTAKAGNIANYGKKEFIFSKNGAWQEFGDLSALGALAYEDSAEASYTPAGSVSQPTFSGNELTSSGKVTAAGSVAAPTFTGDEGDVSVKGTPAGTVSQPTFTGDTMTATGNFTPAGTITMGVDADGTANYTPSGTVSRPNIEIKPTGEKITGIDKVGTLPSATMPVLTTTVENEVLTLGWTSGSFDAGSLPTTTKAIVALTEVAAGLASDPIFSGTGVSLKGTFSGTQGSVSVSGTPEGTVSRPTFSGSEMTATGKFTPEGTNSAPAFTGSEVDVSVKGTPSGTVSQPTFTGTNATITVSAAE